MDWCGHYFSSRVVTGSACLKPMQIHATRPSQLTIGNERDSVTHSLSDRTHVVSVVAATLCPSEIFTRACVARPRFPATTSLVVSQLSPTTHTHPFNGPLSGTTRVRRYQKGKTNLDFPEARDNVCQWHQLGHMQVCTSLQTDNHASTPSLCFYRPDALPAAQPTASKH